LAYPHESELYQNWAEIILNFDLAPDGKRVVALMRLTIDDLRLVDERVGDKPIYLILAMGADKVVRMKPQNLVAGLPLAATVNAA